MKYGKREERGRNARDDRTTTVPDLARLGDPDVQERNHRRNDVPRKGICPSAETTCFAERMAHTVLWRRRDVPTRIACYATIITDTSSHHSPYLSLFLFLYLVRRSLTLPPRSHSFSRSVFFTGPLLRFFRGPVFFRPLLFFSSSLYSEIILDR